MSGEEPSETLKILLEVKKQMAELEGKVDSMQRAETSSSFDADPEETEDSAGSRPISPLFSGKCKQSYGARKAQEGLNECQPRLEIYGGGGKCVPAGSANAIW